MPSGITHELVAEEAKTALTGDAAAAVAKYPDEYYLGAQGPDFLFFYRIGSKSEYNLGKFMHRYRVYDIFNFFLNALSEDAAPRIEGAEREQDFSYILGFLTHYATDSTFHPFVYRYLEEHRAEKREHQQMENDWDVYFLREKKGRSPEKFAFAFSPKKVISHGAVARLYGCLARALERQEVKKHKFDRGIKNFDLYLRFFHGNCFSAQRSWERVEKFFHAKRYLSRLFPRENIEPDYVSGEHFLPFSEGKGANADELFDRAVAECRRLTCLFEEALARRQPLPRADFGNSLLTGKQSE